MESDDKPHDRPGRHDPVAHPVVTERDADLPDEFLPVRDGHGGRLAQLHCPGEHNRFARPGGQYGQYVTLPGGPRRLDAFEQVELVGAELHRRLQPY
jgi:hypothetical protein